MKTKILLLICICSLMFASSCSNQDTNEVNTEEKNFYNIEKEKEAIGNILGKHDVVLLGESIHDSSDIYNLKIELMKYLVEHEGFNLIMLEGSQAELEYYKSKKHPVEEGLNYIYKPDSFQYFFESDAVETTQIDWLPLVYDYPSFDTLLLDEISKEISKHNQELAYEFKSMEIALRTWAYKMLSSGNPEKFDKENIYQKIIDKQFFDELSEPTQEYINKKNFNLVNYINEINFENGYIEYNMMRSRGMADSIMDKLDDHSKSIVWIHNGYAQYEPEKISYDNQTSYDYEENLDSVGSILRDEGIDVYSIGLLFNEAKAGVSPFIEKNISRKDNTKYLEGYIGSHTEDDIFIELQGNDFIRNQQYKLDDLGNSEYTMNPYEQYDGLIYIDSIEK